MPISPSVDRISPIAPPGPAHPSFPHLRGLSQPNPADGLPGPDAKTALDRSPSGSGTVPPDVPLPRASGRRSPLVTFLQRYDAGDAVSFRPLGLGMLNRGYQVVTTAGPYFLKHYLTADMAQIAFQHEVTATLADQGVPALPPLRDRRERTVSTIAGRRFALFPWVMGHHRWGGHYSLAGARAIGHLLGRIHAGLHTALAPVQQPLIATAPHASASVETARRLLRAIRGRTERDEVDVLAEWRLTERCELLDRMAECRPPDHEPIRVGYVHGDFHPLNVLHAHGVGETEPVAVLDWDRVAVLPLTEELARAAVIFFGRGDGTFDLERIHAMVGGYHAVMGLPLQEYDRGSHRLWWERLNDFWMLEWKYDLDDPRCDPQYPAAAAMVPWWTEHYQEVRAAFQPED